MKKLFIRLLALIILSSFIADTVTLAFDNSITEYTSSTDTEDSEKKSEELKGEKETEKDKINYPIRHCLAKGIRIIHKSLHLTLETSAYLSLPEIPPDQA